MLREHLLQLRLQLLPLHFCNSNHCHIMLHQSLSRHSAPPPLCAPSSTCFTQPTITVGRVLTTCFQLVATSGGNFWWQLVVRELLLLIKYSISCVASCQLAELPPQHAPFQFTLWQLWQRNRSAISRNKLRLGDAPQPKRTVRH